MSASARQPGLSRRQRLIIEALSTGPKTTAELAHGTVGGRNFPERNRELKEKGYVIHTKRLNDRSWLYTLAGHRPLTAVPDPAPATGPRPLVLPVWHVCDACSYRFKGNEWPQDCPSCHRPPHWLCSFHEKSHAIDYVPFCDREQKAAA